MHVLDIVENSVRANAKLIEINMTLCTQTHVLRLCIEDDGCGMSEEMVKAAANPFITSRTTRKVGLGIGLFTASCENTGGTLCIQSKIGKGTKLTAEYIYSHIDRPPLGDIAQTVYALTIMNPLIDFVFTAKKHDTFIFDTREIKKTLDGLPITQPEVVEFLMNYLHDGTKRVFGGHEL